MIKLNSYFAHNSILLPVFQPQFRVTDPESCWENLQAQLNFPSLPPSLFPSLPWLSTCALCPGSSSRRPSCFLSSALCRWGHRSGSQPYSCKECQQGPERGSCGAARRWSQQYMLGSAWCLRAAGHPELVLTLPILLPLSLLLGHGSPQAWSTLSVSSAHAVPALPSQWFPLVLETTIALFPALSSLQNLP